MHQTLRISFLLGLSLSVTAQDDASNAVAREEAPLPPKVELTPTPEDAPVVSIRRDESTGDVVEEYRQNGRIYMVKVTPQQGPAYALIDTNGDGKLDKSDGEGVRPVYWTIYEWD
ncbi:MAG: hypothetical protein BWZ07_01339 [Alphaproteobacteria bacterium ADurb.BinA280]|nr:DUF2782 domain-containing protein [Xanthomonadales bacterium]MCC6504742.1 DUF2782 domain-containing protein [Aquimonas sp.]OPZ12405.1 MAG: hypothetical protein BWZ07_01339 [Alphaproteobacteria bacterium ADurb.BinA280]